MTMLHMINSRVFGICSTCSQLMLYQLAIRYDIANDPAAGNRLLTESKKADLRGWLKVIRCLADDFSMKAVHIRVDGFEERMNKNITVRDLEAETRIMRETIDASLKSQLIYRYPDDKSALLQRWQEDWAAVLRAFPSSRSDVIAGVDCWALGHATASAYHFMRVLEYGLRALAADVGRSFDVQNWQNIIDQIESEIRDLGKTLPAGVGKTERLRFLSEAAKEFSYFKDGWRNHVAHSRVTYDEHQARRVMEHVRAFMTVLSSRLDER